MKKNNNKLKARAWLVIKTRVTNSVFSFIKTCRASHSAFTATFLALILNPLANADVQKQTFCDKATFQSESMTSDRKQGISVATGNVELCNNEFIVKSESLSITRNQNKQLLEAKGSPVFFQQKHAKGIVVGTSQQLSLDQNSSTLQLNGAVILTLPTTSDSEQQSDIKISANQLNMKYENQQNGVNGLWFRSTGNPVKVSIANPTSTTELSAKQAFFDFNKRLLTLTDDAFLRDDSIELTAGQLIFDLSSQTWTAPPNSQQRVIIKQLDGESK